MRMRGLRGAGGLVEVEVGAEGAGVGGERDRDCLLM